MTRVDLITGFLGAGKTTFIHRYLRWLRERGEDVLIIENEFGSVSVDSRLLRNEGCAIEDLAGVCMCCKGRDQFAAMLADAAARGGHRVLVEPSGIYDVDEFFSVMDEPRVRQGCEPGCVLAVVDARVPRDLSGESAHLMFTQLAAAGAIVLSKVQLQPPEAVDAAVAWLDALVREGGGRSLTDGEVWRKDWDALTDADFAALQSSGFHRDPHLHRPAAHDEIYSSCITAGLCADEADLRARVTDLLASDRFGKVLRIKGHIRDLEKRWYEVNATRGELSVRPAPDIRRGVLVVIGRDLDEAALDGAFLPRP